MKVRYRKLSFSDIEEYRAVRLNCLLDFPDNFGSTYEDEKGKEKLLFHQYLESDDNENFIIGAFQNTKCVGICGFLRETKKKTAHRGELIQIYVSKEHHGQGIGKEMILKAVRIAFDELGIEQVILSVIVNNKSAITIYEKCGFKEYGLIRDYFKTKNGYFDLRLMIIYNEKRNSTPIKS